VREALELGAALGSYGFLLNRYNAGGAGHAHPASLMPSLEQLRKALAEANAFVRGVEYVNDSALEVLDVLKRGKGWVVRIADEDKADHE